MINFNIYFNYVFICIFDNKIINNLPIIYVYITSLYLFWIEFDNTFSSSNK